MHPPPLFRYFPTCPQAPWQDDHPPPSPSLGSAVPKLVINGEIITAPSAVQSADDANQFTIAGAGITVSRH